MDEATFLKEMGQRIYLRRKALHMTQEQLAEKADVSPQMISNLELGYKAVRPKNLVKVCEVLELSADYVLTGIKQTPPVNHITDKLLFLDEKELKIIEDLIDYMNSKK